MNIITPCPHCYEEVLIHESEINCGIFRHGVYKHNMEGISPHERKEECERLVNENLIHGCGKPFRLEKDDKGKYKALICDYI